MNTKYAPAERTTEEIIRLQSSWFNEDALLGEILDAVPDIIFVLNEQRQIVYANASITTRFKDFNLKDIFGQRPGEVLNCDYAFKEAGGCGTSEFCRTCGAVNSILTSFKGIKNVQECRIIQKDTLESLDLRIFAAPICLYETKFTVFSVTDISHEKRRQVLEKIFFHDIMNTAGGIKGLIQLIEDKSIDLSDEILELLLEASNRIIEEITIQKELSDAESNDLIAVPSQFHSISLLNDINNFFKNHEAGKDKLLSINSSSEDILLNTDKRLLRRVLINLIKNALEASTEKEEIISSCFIKDGMAEFTVWNSCYIPKIIQNQIFQRSFSTKGKGRGLGSYSIRLLTDKYLGGNVTFTSSVENGTLFTIKIPVSLSS